MAPTQPPDSITLKIKVPPGHLAVPEAADGSTPPTADSYTLGILPVSTTIGAVRQQIQAQIPSNPTPERQRLLYGGRALVDNEQTIADALNTRRDPSQTEYVLHLLVKGEGANAAAHAHSRSLSAALQGERTATPPAGGSPHPHPHPHPPHPPGQPQRRPVSGQGFHIEGVGANGQRFQIHQQTINLPGFQHGVPNQHPMGMQMPFGTMPQIPTFGAPPLQMPNMALPQGMMGMPPPFAPPPMMPGQAATPRPAQAPSLLDRQRENIWEMRHLIDAARAQQDPETRTRNFEELHRRLNQVHNYIDPFGGGPTTGTNATQTPNRNPTAERQPAPPAAPRAGFPQPLLQTQLPFVRAGGPPTNQAPQQGISLTEVTTYLLSGPQGPRALLFSPQHGTYTGSLPPQRQPTPTTTTGGHVAPHTPAMGLPNLPQGQNQNQQQQAPQPGQAIPGALAQQQGGAAQELPGPQDPLGPLQPILAHVWLLLRVLIFAYFLLGTNMGYARPMILAGVGMLVWAFRMGAFGDGAPVRRWWDGVVGAPPRPQAQGEGGGGQPAQQVNPNNAAAPNEAGQARAMPTPEETAQRLLNERAQRGNWLREQIRPVERAGALFVASLWPGIGEAHVREQRRLREELEVERRRVEEAERARVQEGATAGQDGKKDEVKEEGSRREGEMSGSSAAGADQETGGSGQRDAGAANGE